MKQMMHICQNIEVPLGELRFTFARSGGRGGQNVNKVETKVELLFDVVNSPSLSDIHRDIVLDRLKSNIDRHGKLRIVSQESRSQWKNRESAVRKFIELLREALKTRKKRTATKKPERGKERRLEEKKRRGQLKKSRRVPED